MGDLPVVTHVHQNHHMDTTRWYGFKPRPDDIVVATSYKSGTTFTQTIVANLLFPDGDLPGPVMDFCPWVDFRMNPLDDMMTMLEAQTHRRSMKSHLPLDGLPYHSEVKYIAVSRDPRDVFMSLLNHHSSHPDSFFETMNNMPGRVGNPFPRYVDDIKLNWRNWITKGWFEWESDGYPYWSHLRHAKTFWDYRHLPNILLVHFNDLLADLDGQMQRIADYLDIEVPAEQWDAVVERCTFASVKKDPGKIVGANTANAFKGGADTFIHKGTNGRWVDVLDEEDLALYDAAMSKLPADYADWLQNGGAVD